MVNYKLSYTFTADMRYLPIYDCKNLSSTEWQGGVVWVGGQRFSHGEWRWDGRTVEPVVITVWGPEQPDNDSDSGCTSGRCQCMGSNIDRYHQFVDIPCNEKFYFICERA